jgi:DNA-binding response OmpR family regulator
MDILLVDDEESVIQVLGEFLADCGYEVVPARDGAEGLRVLESRGGVGLIISDIRMPRMDGIEFLRAVKARYPGTPTILITGHGDEGVATLALQQGACDYLKKPVKLEDLLARVERAESRSRMEADLLGPPPEARRMSEVLGVLTETVREVNAAVTSAMTYLQSFDALWRLSQTPPRGGQGDTLAKQKAQEAMLRELPGLLSTVRERLRHITGAVKNLEALSRRPADVPVTFEEAR